MYQPLGEKFYEAIEDWDWDRNKNDMDIRLVTTMNNFEFKVSFICA